MAEGTITRKDIISDDALAWGGEYAKTLDLAIGKNKEFVTAIVALNEANNKLKGSFNQTEYIEYQKKLNDEANKSLAIWKEQNQLELALISTKKKHELASEGTNKALVQERLELAIINKEIKQEALERLGLVSAYTKLNKSRTDAKNKLRDLIASEQASTSEINKAQKAFDGLDAKVKKADKAVGDFSKNVGNYKSAFSGLGNLFGAFGIVGGLAGFAAVSKDIFNTTKELQSLDLALKSVTGSQDNFQQQQLFLTTIAEKYGLEMKNLTKQYTAFYVAAKDKLAADEIQNLFENIAKSGSALGLSNETLERSFAALNQMLSKGTVASEELRGQLAEALPGSVQAMVKAVQILHPEIKNLTEKGLFEMIKAGKILASEVLPETARQLVIMTGADKAEGIETLTKLTNKLSNEYTEMVSSINNTDTSGFGVFVKNIVSGLSTILQFTSLLFKDEKQLTDYFLNVGKAKGLDEYQKILKNISTTSKENQDITKAELLSRERENIRVNQAIIKAEKEKRESIIGGDRALFHLQTKLEEQAIVSIGKSSAVIKKIKEDALNVKPKGVNPVVAETEKERKAREKAERDRLAAAKKIDDDLYKLQKQRLERSIKLNDDIVKDEEQNDDVRIAAAELSQKKQLQLTDLTKQHLLDADKFVLEKDKLTNSEKIRIKEDAANEIVDIEKKTADEIDKINQFDESKYQKELEAKVSKNTVAMNAELQAENEQFAKLGDLEAMAQADREKAIEDHEKKIYEIKKTYALKALDLQISNLEAELAANDALPASDQVSADKRQKIVETLSKAKLDRSEVEVSTNKKGKEKEVENEKEKAMRILDISSQLTGALTDLANSVFEAKIQNIENEIDKNNEYYDKQIELAGNDERQKDLLQKERDKKNAELEKKKKAEQHKQAVFNKASALAQASISTSLAILNALNTKPFMPLGPTMATLAGVLGAIQIGAILATPIPKYKDGRKGGPAEMAWVGDGGVSEVITRPDGSNPRLTPNVATLTHLAKGDVVHKSVDDYVKTSILNGFSIDNKLISDFQANSNNMYGKELLEELKRNTQAIKGQKFPASNTQKLDINHHLWKMKNTNWN